MARNVLFILGVGSIGWAMLSLFFAGALLPDWMGLAHESRGPLYIESMAVNVGLWCALGAFALFGAVFQRLRLAAALTFVVCGAGFSAGRILAMVRGAKPDIYTVIALALEVAVVVAASAGYVSERTRIARQAKELEKAEKAALEAALAAAHTATPVGAPTPPPVQQP